MLKIFMDAGTFSRYHPFRTALPQEKSWGRVKKGKKNIQSPLKNNQKKSQQMISFVPVSTVMPQNEGTKLRDLGAPKKRRPTCAERRSRVGIGLLERRGGAVKIYDR